MGAIGEESKHCSACGRDYDKLLNEFGPKTIKILDAERFSVPAGTFPEYLDVLDGLSLMGRWKLRKGEYTDKEGVTWKKSRDCFIGRKGDVTHELYDKIMPYLIDLVSFKGQVVDTEKVIPPFMRIVGENTYLLVSQSDEHSQYSLHLLEEKLGAVEVLIISSPTDTLLPEEMRSPREYSPSARVARFTYKPAMLPGPSRTGGGTVGFLDLNLPFMHEGEETITPPKQEGQQIKAHYVVASEEEKNQIIKERVSHIGK